jgi:RNA polymerase-binding transcription factor DksA
MTIVAEPITFLTAAPAAVTQRYTDTYNRWIAQQAAVEQMRRDLDGGPGDEVDHATMAVLLDEQVALAEVLRGQLDDLSRAAERDQHGRYGVCESCGTTIPPERLEIFPATTLCVRCKSATR